MHEIEHVFYRTQFAGLDFRHIEDIVDNLDKVLAATIDVVPQDFVEAYILYSLAALMPSDSKSLRQSWRDEAAQRLSPKMIRDAQREVKKRWKQIRARKK